MEIVIEIKAKIDVPENNFLFSFNVGALLFGEP